MCQISTLRPPDNRAYCERDNCHLSLCACYQLIACSLHRGNGPHARRTDAAKQRTVVYLSGRGQKGHCSPLKLVVLHYSQLTVNDRSADKQSGVNLALSSVSRLTSLLRYNICCEPS